MDEIQESNQTFHELWAMYARGLNGEVVEQAGVLVTCAGVQWPMVNVVFLSSPIQNLAHLRSRLESVAVYTGRKKQFGMLVACDSWLPSPREQAAPVFSEHGWVQISEGAGMICEKPTAGVSVQGLEYRRVDSKELRQAAADINAAGYGFQLRWPERRLTGKRSGAKAALACGLLQRQVSGYVHDVCAQRISLRCAGRYLA